MLFRKAKPKYAIFDWSNVVARAWFSAKEDPNLYISTLLSMLDKYRRDLAGTEFVFALEGNGAQKRREIFPAYKQGRGRSEFPQDIRSESQKILRCLKGLVIRAKDGEADDAIATFIQKYKSKSSKIIIVSEDRDLWQLIQKGVTVWTKAKEISTDTCFEKLKVFPENVQMYKALFGDSSDNLPRIPRARTKSLISISQSAKTLADLSTILPGIDIPESDRKKVQEYQDQINKNFKIVTLQKDLPLTIKKIPGDEKRLSGFVAEKGISIRPESQKRIVG